MSDAFLRALGLLARPEPPAWLLTGLQSLWFERELRRVVESIAWPTFTGPRVRRRRPISRLRGRFRS